MLLILLLAGAVVVYAAFPHRGEEVPGVPWLGEALGKAVDAVPTLGGSPTPGADRPQVVGLRADGSARRGAVCAETPLRLPRSDWIGPWTSWVTGSS